MSPGSLHASGSLLCTPVWRPPKELRRVKKHTRHRAPACTSAASTGLPFLDGLSEEQAPAIFALRREHEAFRTMRQVQKEILTTIAQRLSIHSVPTKVSDDGLAYFTTEDKQTSIALQVGEAEKIEWLVASCTALASLGGGTIRLNFFPQRWLHVPKLDIEIFYFFGKINLYANLNPRANLVLDAAYLERYYKTPGAQGYSMQDLQLESMADPETVPFESRSIDMRVLTGQTSLFYTASATPQNVMNMAEMASRTAQLWLEFAESEPSHPERALPAPDPYNQEFYSFTRKDPDNEKVATLIGQESLEKLLRLATRDSRIMCK
ncbi:g1164 [Coccomyxa viridis]|uniref:G1164 protein n=1 Tax=Coccomyxa viridis TaxID=1274662 RepID=A0ABP1FHE0_9CHLO